ncbi:MAG: hypothetical protein OEY93_12835 [Anaerolineae bacterium]|nr:hypothetical protein [Anaerolineae bacterium]
MNASLDKTMEAKINQYVDANSRRTIKSVKENFDKVIKSYPQWEAALFDEYFFTAKIAGIIKDAHKNNRPVHTKEISSAWADQIKLSSESRQELIAELEPLVEKIIGRL